MSSSATARKPLGVRATPEQHRLITEAAKRSHRSVSSFVLAAALEVAQGGSARTRSPEEVQAAIDRAQALMRRHRQPGQSLVDQVIAERRAEAARE